MIFQYYYFATELKTEKIFFMGYDVIISNSKLNDYGFRVLTSGIDFSQYKRNPILLWMHNRPYRNSKDTILPLGKVENIRVEDDELKGTLVFDEADDFSKQIKAKWDAGTIKMVSAGFDPIERSEEAEHLVAGQKYPTVTKCKLIEVSVVDIGANDDALALYKEGKRIELSLGKENSFLTPINNQLNESKMKKIALKLGLSENATEAEILTKIEQITLKADKVEGLEEQVKNQQDSSIVKLVDSAIEQKKITADKKEHFVNLGKTAGVETLEETLKLMQPVQKPTDIIHQSGGAGVTEYKKLSEVPEEEAIRLRSEDKDTYIKLYRAEYGVYPELK